MSISGNLEQGRPEDPTKNQTARTAKKTTKTQGTKTAGTGLESQEKLLIFDCITLCVSAPLRFNLPL